LIHPVVLYGSETWVLTKRDENQLFVFERKVLRTIYDPKQENRMYRRKNNFELEREFDSQSSRATLVTQSTDPKTYHRRLDAPEKTNK
jgi:hypothetical protein